MIKVKVAVPQGKTWTLNGVNRIRFDADGPFVKSVWFDDDAVMVVYFPEDEFIWESGLLSISRR